MKNKKILLVLLAALFVLLMVGAYFLYDRLGQADTPEQLATYQTEPKQTQTPSSQDRETAATQTQASSSQDRETEPPTEPSETEPVLHPAPDFTVFDLEGNPVRLSDYFGKPIVLNFWASWCGPCKMEMPDFNQKYLEIGQQVQFLMINMTDGSRETVDSASRFIAEQGYVFPVFYDTSYEAAIDYSAYSLPMTFFIDAQGYLVAQATGAISGDTLQEGIDLIYSPQ